MLHEESRPYADKTDEELAAISKWLGCHLEDLEQQRASILAEQRMRFRSPQLVRSLFDAPATGSSRLTMDYFARKMTMAWTIAEDAYAEHSRRYAMRITSVALAIGAGLVLLVCVATRL